MPIIQSPLSVVEIRANLGDAIGTVKYGELGTRIDIQNRGKSVAVLMSVQSADLLTKIIDLAKNNRRDEILILVNNYLPPTIAKLD